MAETIWVLTVGGFVITMAIGIARLAIYMGRNKKNVPTPSIGADARQLR